RLVSRREGPRRAGDGAMSDRGNVRIALKVDVDTHDGLARGVPAIAELLARCGVSASFFIACGPDRMGRRIARLLDPRFGAKLLRTRAVAVYGWLTLLSGTVLLSHRVAAAFSDAVARLAVAGREVAAYDDDHARLPDRLPRLTSALLRAVP